MRARLGGAGHRSQLTIFVLFFWIAEDPVHPLSLIPLPSINLKTDRRWTWLGVGAWKVIAHGIVWPLSLVPIGVYPNNAPTSKTFCMRNATEVTKYYGIKQGRRERRVQYNVERKTSNRKRG